MTMTLGPNTLEPNIALWAYAGGGTWNYGTGWTYPATDPQTLKYFADKGVRPIRTLLSGVCEDDGDVAGSLVMFDMSLATPAHRGLSARRKKAGRSPRHGRGCVSSGQGSVSSRPLPVRCDRRPSGPRRKPPSCARRR